MYMYTHVCFLYFTFSSQEQNGSGDSAEAGESKISYIDVPDKQQNHQYAVPNVTRAESDSNIASHASYYSSAPVPVEYHSHTLPSYAKIRNSVSTLLPDKNRTKKETVQKLTQNPISSSKSNDSSLGYFRNGHYYDPGPNPEVYAPASSYSDRSTKLLSTFQSDLRRTPSISSSVSSAGGSVSSLYYNHLYSFTCEIITCIIFEMHLYYFQTKLKSFPLNQTLFFS